MSVPLLLAVTDASREADLVVAFENGNFGVNVVRRCVDLADLLAVAAAGTARAVLLAPELRRLDRDAVSRLAACGLAVVGLASPGDEVGETRLRQLGVSAVLSADAGPERIATALVQAVSAGVSGPDSRPHGYADPQVAPADPVPDNRSSDRRGAVVAVWGPAGAPGRSSVAVGLATESACLDVETLLVDADTYGGAVAQLLGLLDESPGVAAAARQANNGTLDMPALARLAHGVAMPGRAPALRVLTGLTRSNRWPEIRSSGLAVVYELARRLAALTVVDCGFCLEADEELSFDTAAPQRNAATLATLAEADVIVVVGAADPLGLQRLVRGLSELRDAVPDCQVRVVVNRLRGGPINGDAQSQIREALTRYSGVDVAAFVPYGRPAFDRALASGRCLAEVAATSPARVALSALAARLVTDLVGAAGVVPGTRGRGAVGTRGRRRRRVRTARR